MDNLLENLWNKYPIIMSVLGFIVVIGTASQLNEKLESYSRYKFFREKYLKWPAIIIGVGGVLGICWATYSIWPEWLQRIPSDLIIVGIIVFVWDRLEKAFGLLCGISDDINDIKEKLGLQTFARTPAQKDKDFLKTLKECIYEGENIKELFREKELKKYNTSINIWIRESGMVKYCPKCQKYFEDKNSNLSGEFSIRPREYKWNCDICRGNLILKKKEVVV